MTADSDESARPVHELQLRCAQVSLGAVTRPERMARPLFVDVPLTRQGRGPLRVLIAHVDGQPSGYAVFSRKEDWTSFSSKGTVEVTELAATDPATLLALARRLGLRPDSLDHDLQSRVGRPTALVAG